MIVLLKTLCLNSVALQYCHIYVSSTSEVKIAACHYGIICTKKSCRNVPILVLFSQFHLSCTTVRPHTTDVTI